MSQTDMNAANASGASFRADLNNHLAALASTSIGTSAPSTTFAGQLWVDSTGGASYLKIRNADNDAWITVLQLNQTSDVAEAHTNMIDTNSIQDDAVTSAKIAATAVDATALASNAVTSAKITDANVTTAKIADGAVTSAKLASGLATITGEIRLWATAAAPTGWLFCDGASISRSTYSALFAVIGTTYGTVDGNTFNVPDLKGRSPVGVGTGDATGATAWTLAEKGGEETHVLTTAEIAAHTHGPGSFAVESGGDLVSDGAHVAFRNGTSRTSAVTGTSASTGGGTAHNTIGPVLGLNYIIKT